MYVRTYVCVCHAQECQIVLMCMQLGSEELCVTSTDMWEYRIPSLVPSLAIEDGEERHFLTMEDG